MQKIKSFLINNYLLLVFIISFTASLGSLIFSEVYNLDPCKLCWYQRTFMYPLAILSAIAVIFKVKLRKIYILALTVPGMLIGLYQYISQMTLGKSDTNVCGGSISCTFIDFRLAGFITIPFLSFVAFLLIILIVLASHYFAKKQNVVEQ